MKEKKSEELYTACTRTAPACGVQHRSALKPSGLERPSESKAFGTVRRTGTGRAEHLDVDFLCGAKVPPATAGWWWNDGHEPQQGRLRSETSSDFQGVRFEWVCLDWRDEEPLNSICATGH